MKTGTILKIDLKDLWEILQRMYDSEINIATKWMWDWGLEYSIDTFPYEKVEITVTTGETDFSLAYGMMVSDVIEKYPDSAFSERFNSKFN